MKSPGSPEISPVTDRLFAVVTGASSGIGYELARQFGQHGYDLLICAQSERIDQAARDLSNLGVSVDVCQADLATREGVENLYARIRASGRPVDAIALNAGVGMGGEFARETGLEAELNLIRLNVISTVHLAKLVLRDMVARGQGHVLVTSSIAAAMPGPFEAVYSASKAFIQSFAQAVRNELQDTGVTVVSLMPGATETGFFHRAGLDDTRIGQSHKDDAATVARQGFEALLSGRDHVVAGSPKNNVMVGAAKILPQATTAEMHGKLSEKKAS